jgi:hypothetical protein
MRHTLAVIDISNQHRCRRPREIGGPKGQLIAA